MTTQTITQTTAPVCEPITLIEAKEHLRVSGDNEDQYIAALIATARRYVENYTGRQLVCATWRLGLKQFPGAAIFPPKPPLVAVSSITYLDSGRTRQTLASSVYDVRTTPVPPFVEEAYGQVWASAYEETDSVQVNYVAGWVAKFTAVASTDVMTVSGRTLANADIIRLSNSGGTLPQPLLADTDYHVRDYSAGTFKLAATAGGGAIDIVDAGTGTNFVGVLPPDLRHAMKLMISQWYELREPVITGTIVTPIPNSVEALLWPWKIE